MNTQPVPRLELVAAGVAMLVVGACGGAPPPEPAPEPLAAPEVPEAPAERYIVLYGGNDGIRHRDTGPGSDTVLVATTGAAVTRNVSPNRTQVAVAYTQGDSTKLAIIDASTGGVTPLHAMAAGGSYTMAWSQDNLALGIGYRDRRGGGILIADAEGHVRDVGCSASNRFVAWVPDNNLVVGDGAEMYVVNPRNCATIWRIRTSNKEGVSYAPDGRLMLFYRHRFIQYRNQPERMREPELYVSRYNLADAQKIVTYTYRPQNARWSPDSRKIVFEARSQKYFDVTNLAFHDVQTGRTRFPDEAEGPPSDVSSDRNAYWSPNSARIVYDRTFARTSGGQSWNTNQKVVLNPATGAEKVLAEEIVRGGAIAAGEDPIGETVGWVDDEHIVLRSPRWVRILNVDTDASYDLPPDIQPLYVTIAGDAADEMGAR